MPDNGIWPMILESEKTKRELSIVTNGPAPYRVAYFNAIVESGAYDTVTVAYETPCFSHRNWEHLPAKYTEVLLPSKQIGRGLRSIYIPLGISTLWELSRADDVVVSEFSIASFVLVLFAKSRRKKIAILSDESQPTAGRAKNVRYLLRRLQCAMVDKVFCASRRGVNYFVENYAKAEKVRHVGLSWRYNEYASDEFVDGRSLERELSLSYVLFVGSIDAVKGVDRLLTAWTEVSRVLEDVELLMVGGGPDEERYRDECVRLGISERVSWLGNCDRSRVKQLQELAIITVLPSRSEAYGLVVWESMARGTAVVVSDRVAAASDLIIDGTTGWVVNGNSIEELVDALINGIRAVNEDPHKFNVACRAIAQKYDLNYVTNATVNALVWGK